MELYEKEDINAGSIFRRGDGAGGLPEENRGQSAGDDERSGRPSGSERCGPGDRQHEQQSDADQSREHK